MGFPFRKTYYFVVAKKQDRPIILGPYDSEEEARNLAWRKLQGVVWDIVESTSKDASKITQSNKYKALEETDLTGEEALDYATKRAKHKID